MNADLEKYFKLDTKSNCTTFIGDKLEVFIPTRYLNYGLLEHGEKLSVLAIFDVKINDSEKINGICIPSMITTNPSETYNATIDDISYLVAVYKKFDVFIENMLVIQNDNFGYVLWNEFISLGNLPKFINYENISLLFDLIAEICGIKFPVNHVVFEMVYAHLFRDSTDITKEYRLSDMSKPPVFVELRNVAYGPDTTSAKLLGSYFGDGLNSSLVNASDKTSELDHILFS